MLEAFEQVRYLRMDIAKVVRGRWWRWYSALFNAGVLSITGYRLSRSAYLAFGRGWQVIHTLLAPLALLFRPFGSRLQIHYTASIGPGLTILHADLGVVISGHATIGRDLCLTGGNCIGSRQARAGIHLGDGVTLGANAVVLGPCTVGDHVTIGAGGVLVGDAPAGATMVGVPARQVPAARPDARSDDQPG